MNGDIQLQCPYDKSHQIRQSRMVFHLRKCAKNHPNSKKKVCIYDVCHVLDPEDYEDHINSCPAKEAVIQYEKPSLEPEPGLPITISNVANNWPQDTTDWPQDAADWPQDTADWPQDEADQAQNNSAAFVSPLHNINNQLVSRTLIGASKSVKKQFILEQRQKFQQAQRDDEKNDKGNDSHATPAATAKQSMKNDTNTSIQPKSNIKSDSKLKNGSINNPVNVKLNENSVTQNASSVAVKPVTLSVAESVTQNVSTKSVTDTLAQPSHNTGAIPKKPFNYAAALHKKTSIEKPSLLENISSNKSVNKAIVCNDNMTVKVYNEKENISNNSIITSTVKGSIITNEIEDVENFSIKEDDFQEVKRKSHKKTNKQQEKSTTKVDNKEVNTTGKKPSRYAGTNQGNKQNSAAGHGGGRRK